MAASRGVQSLLAHDAFDVLEHDDRIVDHDADRQHHAEQSQRVDRVAEHRQAGEGADQRNRNRDDRNQRGTPALQEQVHHQENEDHRHRQRQHHFVDRDFDEARRVVRHRIRQALAGIPVSARSTVAVTLFATSSALAPGCRKIPTRVAFWPL